ncbi:DUF945 family protein [Vibrio sp. WJH972]
MNDVKKYTAIAGGVLLVACWPLVVGQIGEKLIQDNIARIDDTRLNVELVSYDRGYFSSNVLTKVELVDQDIKKQFEIDKLPTEWYLDSAIDHNLFTLDAVTKFRDYPDIPFQITTQSQLSGDTHIDAELDQFDYAFSDSKDAWTLSVQPAHLLADVTLDKVLSASFNMLELKMTNQFGEFFSFSDLQSSAQGQMHDSLWVGDQSASIASIEFGRPDEEALSVTEGIRYTLNSKRVDAVENESTPTPAIYSSHTVVNIDTLISSEQQFDDITIDISAGNIDAENLGALLDIVQSDNPQQSEKQAIVAIDALVNHGLFINVDKLGLSYLNQPIDSSIKLNIASGTEHISHAPMTLLGILNGDIFVQIPKGLVEQVPNLQLGIDQLKSKEYIVETEANFEFTATIEAGNIVFANGQKTPILSALMPLFLR